jgi:hypothetical protein
MGLAAGVPVTVGLGWYPRTLSLPNSEVVDWVDAEVLGSRDAESCKSLVRDQVSESLSLSRTARPGSKRPGLLCQCIWDGFRLASGVRAGTHVAF